MKSAAQSYSHSLYATCILAIGLILLVLAEQAVAQVYTGVWTDANGVNHTGPPPSARSSSSSSGYSRRYSAPAYSGLSPAQAAKWNREVEARDARKKTWREALQYNDAGIKADNRASLAFKRGDHATELRESQLALNYFERANAKAPSDKKIQRNLSICREHFKSAQANLQDAKERALFRQRRDAETAQWEAERKQKEAGEIRQLEVTRVRMQGVLDRAMSELQQSWKGGNLGSSVSGRPGATSGGLQFIDSSVVDLRDAQTLVVDPRKVGATPSTEPGNIGSGKQSLKDSLNSQHQGNKYAIENTSESYEALRKEMMTLPEKTGTGLPDGAFSSQKGEITSHEALLKEMMTLPEKTGTGLPDGAFSNQKGESKSFWKTLPEENGDYLLEQFEKSKQKTETQRKNEALQKKATALPPENFEDGLPPGFKKQFKKENLDDLSLAIEQAHDRSRKKELRMIESGKRQAERERLEDIQRMPDSITGAERQKAIAQINDRSKKQVQKVLDAAVEEENALDEEIRKLLQKKN